METHTLQICYTEDIEKIEKIKQGDWIDLRCAEDISIAKDGYININLGVIMKVPEDYEIHIVPRSSTFRKWGIIQTNSLGIIDQSYCGKEDILKMPVFATRDTKIKKNDRICQFRIIKKMIPISFKEIKRDQIKEETRGGFGSTG